ncbi:OLC1v1020819C1 [Oldenlandia corymbosa var. corymbosa]|uniref:OLC1v1020819C1 n=1 Tax=Oldenlandia corymbosa var. corymbosa TaxID=529605 RepID=A0AAV1BUA7_OLDCO|nr:OLC1v1020819C1 [Oldenlandia corymbosa var. corymbosa]
MDGDQNEMVNFIMVWVVVLASLCYCHMIGSHFSSATIIRPLALLPVICLFVVLPMNLTTISLGGTTAFFVAWLANFKLLLFAFDQGPLSSNPPTPLPYFIALACLPIKAAHQQYQSHPKSTNEKIQKPLNGHKSTINYASKITILAIVMLTVKHAHSNPWFMLLIYCAFLYLALELILAMTAGLARGLMRAELEPQFDEPYLATSLQDFWGKRWNLMASKILRPTVYDPVRSFCEPMAGRKWSPIPAVMATFLVSGLMHEWILYNIGRVKPTGELTCFFLLQGASVAAEIGIKRILSGRFQVPVALSRLLQIAFVLSSSFWLFFPPFRRGKADTKTCTEILAFIEFLKTSSLVSPSSTSCPFL